MPKFAEYTSDETDKSIQKESIYKVQSNNYAVNHREEDFNKKTVQKNGGQNKIDDPNFG